MKAPSSLRGLSSWGGSVTALRDPPRARQRRRRRCNRRRRLRRRCLPGTRKYFFHTVDRTRDTVRHGFPADTNPPWRDGIGSLWTLARHERCIVLGFPSSIAATFFHVHDIIVAVVVILHVRRLIFPQQFGDESTRRVV